MNEIFVILYFANNTLKMSLAPLTIIKVKNKYSLSNKNTMTFEGRKYNNTNFDSRIFSSSNTDNQ